MAMESNDVQSAFQFSVKFQGSTVPLPDFPSSATLQSLKDAIAAKTRVPGDRQKITGLFKGKSPPPSASLQSLVKSGPLAKKSPPYVLMLMGTPDEAQASTPTWRPSALLDLEEAVARGDVNAYPVLAHGMPLNLRIQLLRAHATTHAAAPALRNHRRLQPLKVPLPPAFANKEQSVKSSPKHGPSSSSISSKSASYSESNTRNSAGGDSEADLGAITKALLWALRGRRSRHVALSQRDAPASVEVGKHRARDWSMRMSQSTEVVPDDEFIGIMVRWAIVAEASRGAPGQNQASTAAAVAALPAPEPSTSPAAAEDAPASDIATCGSESHSDNLTLGKSSGPAPENALPAKHLQPSSEVSPDDAFEAALAESASARWATAGPVARLLWEAGCGLLSVEVGALPLFVRSPGGLVSPAPGRAATLAVMTEWASTATNTAIQVANASASDYDIENSDEDALDEDDLEHEDEEYGQGYRNNWEEDEEGNRDGEGGAGGGGAADEDGTMVEGHDTDPAVATSSQASQLKSCELAAEVCEQYRAVGRFLGACLWHGHGLGTPMPTAFFQTVLHCASKHLLVLVSSPHSSSQAKSLRKGLSSSSCSKSNADHTYGVDDGETFAGFPASVGRASGLFHINRPPPPLGPSSPFVAPAYPRPRQLPSPVAMAAPGSLESVHVGGTHESAEGTCFLPAHVRYLLGLTDGDRIFVASSSVSSFNDDPSLRAAASKQASHKSSTASTVALSVASEVTWAAVAPQQSNHANNAIAAAAALDLTSQLQAAQAAAEAAARAAEVAEEEAKWAVQPPVSARTANGNGRLLVSENKRQAARNIAAYRAERNAIKQQKTGPHRQETQATGSDTSNLMYNNDTGMPENLPASNTEAGKATSLSSLLHATKALHNGVLDVGVGYAFWQPLPLGSHECEDRDTEIQGVESCPGVVLALTPVALVSADSGGRVAQALVSETTQHRLQETQPPRDHSKQESSSHGGTGHEDTVSSSVILDSAIVDGLGDGDSSVGSSVHSELGQRKWSNAQARWRRAYTIVRAAIAFQKGGDKQLLASCALAQYLEMACGCEATRRGARLEVEWVLSQRADLLDDRGELPPRFADLGDFARSFAFGVGTAVEGPSAEEIDAKKRGGEERGGDSVPSGPAVVPGGGLNDTAKRGLLRAWLKQRISGDLMPQAYAIAEGLREVVPAPLLCLFTASELQSLFGGGDPHVSDSTLRQWRRACVYETYENSDSSSTMTPSTAEASSFSTSPPSIEGKANCRPSNVFDASHPSARGVWECLARANGTERAAVWRFVTGTDAPPPLFTALRQKTTAQQSASEGLSSELGGGGEEGESPLFTLALRGPSSASGGADDDSSGTDSSNNDGQSGSDGGGGNAKSGSGSSTTNGKLFTASTCVRTLYVPHEPFESIADVAATLAESVALGLHPNLANGDDASSSDKAAGASDDFTEAQRRLRAAVTSAATRIAKGAAASGGDTGGSAAGSGAVVDPLTMRSLFPNSYQCPRCGCGPIDHAACDNLKTHHGERRAGVKVSNACPACGWFSSELADWLPWDGSLE